MTALRRHTLRFITGGVVIGAIGAVGWGLSRVSDVQTVVAVSAVGILLGLITYAVGVLVCDALGWVEL